MIVVHMGRINSFKLELTNSTESKLLLKQLNLFLQTDTVLLEQFAIDNSIFVNAFIF